MTWLDLTAPYELGRAGRFAPTPTGALHIGNAYSALLAIVSARSLGFMCHLRVDDLDQQRVHGHDHESGQLRDLEWLGFHFDTVAEGSLYRQSSRHALYERALHALNDSGWIYPCYCTRREVIAAAPHANDEGHIYPGTCRPVRRAERVALNLDALRARPLRGRYPVLRLNVDALITSIGDDTRVSYHDLIQGVCQADLTREVGDFVLQRRDGVYGYQLSCAVDDYTRHNRVVVRGADLVTSTHRQRLILKALGVSEERLPSYGHAGLVVDASGERLAKRNQSQSLTGLREAGVDPARLRARLSLALGGPDTDEVEAMIAQFSWSQVSSTPVRLDLSDIPKH